MHQLPPLKALRAFEAAARHLSIKDAAEELHVTPSAVSQLIRSLEDRLGTPLFWRLNRALVLTEAGQSYLPPVHHAFRRISKATQQVVSTSANKALTVSVMPNFAVSWLVPRLARFQARHPAIDLRIKSTAALTAFGPDGVDVAIRHGLGRYPGLRSDRLMTVEFTPVAAPALMTVHEHPLQPADVVKLPLLHDEARSDWRLWLDAQGLEQVDVPGGPSFDDEAVRMRAAVTGLGAALIPSTLVKNQLDDGQLVSLSANSWPSELAYYCVCPRETAERPNIAAFRDWLIEEAERDGNAVCDKPATSPSNAVTPKALPD